MGAARRPKSPKTGLVAGTICLVNRTFKRLSVAYGLMAGSCLMIVFPSV